VSESHGRRRARSSPILRLVGALVAIWVAYGAPLPAQEVEPSPRPALIESLDVNVVNVEVFVSTRNGDPVLDLTQKDFEILEDGKKMAVTYFRVPRLGVAAATPEISSGAQEEDATSPAGAGARAEDGVEHIALLVDNLSIQPQNRRLVLDRLQEYLRENSGVRFLIASYDGYINVRQPFTSESDLLLKAIEGLETLSPLGVLRYANRQALFRKGLQDLTDIQEQIRRQGFSLKGPDDHARDLRQYAREVELHAAEVHDQNQAQVFEMSHLVNALAALPGRKALVYVSEGMPMRPGATMSQAIQDLLSRDVERRLEGQVGPQGQEALNDARATSLRNIEAQARGSRIRGKKGRKDRGKLNNEFQRIAALANANGVSFYTLIPQGEAGVGAEFGGDAGLMLTPQLQRVRDQNFAEPLRVMAENTGGVATMGRDIGGLIDQARRDFSSYYSLGYSPTHLGDGRYHEIEVKVRRKRVDLRYRIGYFDKPLEARLADRVSAALLLEQDDNPLGLSFEIDRQRPTQSKELWLVGLEIEVPLAGLTLLAQGEVYACDVQLLVAASDAEGNTAPLQTYDLHIELPQADFETARQDTYRARLELEMREGPQRLAIGLVDAAGQSASFLGKDVMIGSANK